MIKYSIFFLTIFQIKSDCGSINDIRCQGCEIAEVCDNCYESYWDATAKKCVVPEKKIENCRQYKNENTCENCFHGYFEKSETKCEKITIENCLMSEKADECSVCKGGYETSLDKKSCTDIKCKESNCKACMKVIANGMTINMCAYCEDGYAVNALFTGCTSNSKHCAGLHIIGTCKMCKGGYYMNKNDCVESDIIPLGIDDDEDGVKKLVVFAFGVLFLFF